MNTEALIQDLAVGCTPVKPLQRPVVRCLKWIFASLLMMAIGVVFLGPRGGSILFSTDSATATAVLIGVSITAAVSAFILAVPGIKSRRFYLVISTALASWLGVVVYIFFSGDTLDPHTHFLCIKRIIILSISPGILLFYMLRQAAPHRTGTVGLLALFSVMLFSCLGLDFVCPNPGLSHVLVWHILPASILSGTGIFVGRLVFHRNLTTLKED